MTKKQWLIGFVLVDFTVLTAWILAQYGWSYLGFLRDAQSTLAGVQVLIDLVIALTLFLVWMWSDAKRRGISPLPYLVELLLNVQLVSAGDEERLLIPPPFSAQLPLNVQLDSVGEE